MYRKIQIDSVNKSAQFSVKENLSALTFRLMGLTDGGSVENAKPLNFVEQGGKINVRVELIRKNQPNVTLMDLGLGEVVKVTDILYKGGVSNTIPVALGENLVLNDEAYLLVTLEWRGGLQITKMEVFENRVLGNTSKPLAIKAVSVDEQKEVNTEFYNLAVFDSGVTSLETIKTEVGDDGVAVSQKQEMSFDYMKMLSPEENGVVLQTEVNQKVKFYGTGKVYLVQV